MKPRRIPDCHPDKPHRAFGECGPCYSRRKYAEGYRAPRRSSHKPQSRCHPDRKHHARGLCFPCYKKSEFVKARPSLCHPNRPHRAKGLCAPCYRREYPPDAKKRHAYNRRWGQSKIGQAWNRNRAVTRYGLTLADYDRMLAAQDGVCAICKKTDPHQKSLSIDHDHRTEQVRGLLCGSCNFLIGYLERRAAFVGPALTYLKRYSDGQK